jgi:hypothetical protein
MRRRPLWFGFLVILVLLAGYLAGCASGSGQPHMTAALDELRAARQELDAAESGKGGHRTRAIALIDDAITQVREGIDFAASH